MFVGRPVRVAREVLRQGVAEPHVDGALDLALAQERVDRPADVVGGDHPLDEARLAVDDDKLGGIAEGRVDRRVSRPSLDRVGPVDAVLALIVDSRPAAVGLGLPAGVGDRAGAHEGARGCRWSGPRPSSRVVSTTTRTRAGSTPSSSTATWTATVCTPWPISVQQWRTSTCRPSAKRTTARATSRSPLPRPEFLRPSPTPDRPAGGHGLRRRRASTASRQRSAPPAAVVHDLPGPPHHAGPDDVAPSDLLAGDADLGGQAVHDAFHGELGLVRRRSPGTLRNRVVRPRGDRLHVDRSGTA